MNFSVLTLASLIFFQIICAGYCAYGSATELVLTYGHGVERFTLDPSLGEFVMTAENMRIPEQGKTIYSINEGQFSFFGSFFLCAENWSCVYL